MARQPPGDGEPVALRVERVAPARWETVGDWDQAVAAAARPSVFLTRDWVVAWWRSFGTGLEPLLLRVSDADGRTAGLAPLYLERHGFGTVSRLGLLGDRVVGSEYLGLVARAGRERAVAGAVAAWLAGAGVRWGVAELSGLLEGDPAAAALEWALRARARRVRSRVHGCSMVPLPRDFDTYLRSLGSGFRRSYRQRSNKLRRTFAVRCYQTEHAAELPEHLERLFQMHNVQWMAKGHTGVFADPRMRAFYLDVSARLLRSGRLRFWQLEVDGVVRAAQFGFAYGGVLHSLQEAYDTTFREPGIGGLGVVLRASVLQCAIEEGLSGYDFLGGVEEFKTRWGTRTHHIRNVQLGAAGLRGGLAWLAVVGGQGARTLALDHAPETVLRTLRLARARRGGGLLAGRRGAGARRMASDR